MQYTCEISTQTKQMETKVHISEISDKIPKEFMIMIGLPGSGKSTWCNNYASTHDHTIIVSSDAIREELFGNENTQGNPEHVFNVAKDRIAKALNGYRYNTVILDATNVKKKNRIRFINNIKKLVTCDFTITAVWMAVPVSKCLEQNKMRERTVPNNVIDKMYKTFCPPGKEEGFDRFMIEFSDFDMDHYNMKEFFRVANAFDQHNKHHSLTLGEHCQKAFELIENNGLGINASIAALYHDIGKLATASYVNGKGIKTDELHFYQHHCCGAYDIPFYLRTDTAFSSSPVEDYVEVANLIYYHMHYMLQWKDSEKAMERDRSLLGKNFCDKLDALHEADISAH